MIRERVLRPFAPLVEKFIPPIEVEGFVTDVDDSRFRDKRWDIVHLVVIRNGGFKPEEIGVSREALEPFEGEYSIKGKMVRIRASVATGKYKIEILEKEG